MLKSTKWFAACLMVCLCAVSLFAQTPEEPVAVPVDASTTPTEASDPDQPVDKPLDDIVKKELVGAHRVLPYPSIREADIFFEKRIWRIIDVREKMNQPFVYPEDPFFKMLSDAATKGDIRVYSTEDDKFTKQLTPDEVTAKLFSVDTAVTFDPETYEEKIAVVRNETNWEDVKRFRLKEVWYFDKQKSELRVRILGIAPLIDVKDNNGNFRYESPMFWVYYPDCRELLARHKAFNLTGNDAAPMTWEDVMEMRYFASYIYKESNVFDRKIEAYSNGVDRLVEGDKIRQEIFNFEHDLWSY
jgi:gliding motility associated protien GldN